jgi:hypothetical protein
LECKRAISAETIGFGRYPSSAAAFCIRSRRSSDMLGSDRNAFDTVEVATPAARATVAMVMPEEYFTKRCSS